MRTKQQHICRRARRQICCAEKASQSFTSADVKAVKSVFCRDMRALQRGFSCPLRGNSPSGRKHFTRSERRILRYKRTIEAQSAANPFRKSGFATFSTVSKRRPWLSLFSSVLPRGTGKCKKAVSFHRFCFTIGKSCAIIIQHAYRAHSRT